MIASDGSPYYPTSNIWWHMKHRLFLLGQLIFSLTKHDALSGCVGIQGQKGDRIPACFRFARKWWRGWGDKLLQCDRSVGHDMAWFFTLRLTFLMSTRCLSVFVWNNQIIVWNVFIHYSLLFAHFLFDTLELLCLWCVCWAYDFMLSFGDVMDVYQVVQLFVRIDDIVLCSGVIGICATHSENELKDSCLYDECPNP